VDTLKPIEENEKVLTTLADTVLNRGYDAGYNDSLTYEGIFIQNLLLVLKSPRSFNYKFPLLVNQSSYHHLRISMIYSDDSLLRVLQWLSPSTGTFHHFPVIFQAKNKKNKIIYSYPEATEPEGSIAGTCYTGLFRIKPSSKQLYLCVGFGQASSSLPFETIETFEVTGDSIKNSCILPDSAKFVSGLLIDRSATWDNDKVKEIPNAEYDTKNQIFAIPEIIESTQTVKWTGKSVRYKFDGLRFEKQK
jgi:hypothetical protein